MTLVRTRTKIISMNKKNTKDIINQISKIREAANLFITSELNSRGIEGVLPAHGIVFSFLFKQNGSVPIMSLVNESGRSKSTVTGIVKTLERYGYIYKETSPNDGRSFHIGLTEKGLNVKNDFEEISALLIKTVYTGIPVKDREYAAGILNKILTNFE